MVSLSGASDAFQNLAVLRANEIKAVQAVYIEEVVAGNSIVTFNYYVAYSKEYRLGYRRKVATAKSFLAS